jgi:CRP-like cAMP-binding protein
MILTLERILTLKQLELFAAVDEEALIELAGQLTESEVPAGHTLLAAGTLGRELIICVEGQLRIEQAGKPAEVHDAPAIVGVLAALDPHPHQASVTTLTPCRLLRLDHDTLVNELLINNTLACGVIRYLVRQARQA